MTAPQLDRLCHEVASALGSGPSEVEIARQRAQVLAAAADMVRRPQPWRAWLPAAVAAAAGAALLFLVVEHDRQSPGSPLRGQIGQRAVMEGEVLAATLDQGVEVLFSEGSRVTVAARSKARLVRLGAREVDFAIENGAVSSNITSGQGVVWTFRGGPYRVRVLGTSLRVEWQPVTERLVVAVTHGRVHVSDDRLDSGDMIVAAGQRLVASAQGMQLGRIDPDRSDEKKGPSLDANDDDPPARETSPARSQRPSPPGPSPPGAPPQVQLGESAWRQHAAAGRYGAAITAAEREGFEQLLQRLPAAQLLELADAARLGGKVQRAQQALLRLRQRFAWQAPAQTAAFRLGRLAYDHSRDYVEAARWFATVLQESRGGPHAADATGRLMETLARQGKSVQAERMAREYISRYPDGTYAVAARSLLAGGGP